MTRILVLYYSSYGHIETLAKTAAEAIREAGAEAVIKRVPELMPEAVARKANVKLDQDARFRASAQDLTGGTETGLSFFGLAESHVDPGQVKKGQDGLKPSLAPACDIQSSQCCLVGLMQLAAALVQIGQGEERRRALPVLA